jgi:hypothetical protein
MDSIWLGLWPGSRTTRVLAMQGPSQTILKANLSLRPSSPRAVTSFLEALALWEGRPVRAVLVADDASMHRHATTLFRDTFEIFGERTALYELSWAPPVVARRRDDQLGGMGKFADLERLLVHAVAR